MEYTMKRGEWGGEGTDNQNWIHDGNEKFTWMRTLWGNGRGG